MNATSLFLSLIISLLGAAYFAYGKKQGEFWFMGAGAGMMLATFMISAPLGTLLAGAALVALPFAARRWFD